MEIDFGDGDRQVIMGKVIFHWKDVRGLTHLKATCLV
jgi:hypothetical protein